MCLLSLSSFINPFFFFLLSSCFVIYIFFLALCASRVRPEPHVRTVHRRGKDVGKGVGSIREGGRGVGGSGSVNT